MEMKLNGWLITRTHKQTHTHTKHTGTSSNTHSLALLYTQYCVDRRIEGEQSTKGAVQQNVI